MAPGLIEKALVVIVDDDGKIGTQQEHTENDRHSAADEKQCIRCSGQIFDQHRNAREGQNHTNHRASSRRTDNLLALFQLRLREDQLEQGVDQKADQKHKRANQHNKKQLHASPSSTGAEMTYCTGISNLSVSRWSSIWNA